MRLFEEGDAVLAVVAHPDDAELLFYGSLRVASSRGARVEVIVLTVGERSADLRSRPSLNPRRSDRVAECERAFAGTSIKVRALSLPDGGLSGELDLASRLERALRDSGCSVLLTHDPSVMNDHGDHIATGRAAVNAARRVEVGTILVGQPVQPGSGFEPTVLVDVTPYIDDKIAALHQHASQRGRWYLTARFTSSRAEAVGWAAFPRRTASGRAYEALRQIISVDESSEVIPVTAEFISPGLSGARDIP